MKVPERRLGQRYKGGPLYSLIPTDMVEILGVKLGENIRFHAIGSGRVLMTPAGKDLTKKDLTDVEKAAKELDRILRERAESEKPAQDPHKPGPDEGGMEISPEDLEKLRLK